MTKCPPATAPGRRGYKEASILLLLLALLIFSLYSPALNAPFLFDDTNNIEQNSAIHITELSLPALKRAAQGPRPVAMLSFALGHYLHGLSPFWFRITNLSIHFCTAITLYFVLCSTTALLFAENKMQMQRYRWLPMISTLLWAVHPLQIQSVTYIVQRMNSLAGLFFLLSLLSYIHARLSDSGFRRIFLGFCCASAALLAAGSKPNAAVLPLILVLYEYLFFRQRNGKTLFKHLLLLAAALAVMSVAAYCLMNGHPADRLAAWYAKNDFTPVQRVMTECRVVILYLSLLALPHPSRLNIDHDILLSTSLTAPPSTALSLAMIIIFLLLGIFTTRKLPLLAFAIFWFFINLIIESTVIPLDFIFEHRTYIPSMMLIPGIIFTLIRFLQRDNAIIILTILLTLWSAWTYDRNSVWKSGIALWQDSAKKSPNKPRPHESLAYYLEKEHRYSEAIRHYARAIQLNPKNATTYNNIGNLYMKIGELHTALNHYAAALRIRPEYKEALNNRGNALSKIGKFKQAIVYYEKALELDPNYAKVHANLANALAALGDLNLSMNHYNQAVELDQNNVEAHYNRSILLLRLNRFAEAEQALQQVVEKQENFKEAYNNLGVAYEHLGRTEAATESYRQALRIDPEFKDARRNLQRLQIRLKE